MNSVLTIPPGTSGDISTLHVNGDDANAPRRFHPIGRNPRAATYRDGRRGRHHGSVSAPPLPSSTTPPVTRSGARTTQRRGRMSEAKRRTLADLGPTWLLNPADLLGSPANPLGSIERVGPRGLGERLDRVFGRSAPRMLDIGVGTGEATVAWAAAHPDHDVVAVELHLPGIARLLASGHGAGLTNVRVLEADVTRLLDLGPDGRPRPDPAGPTVEEPPFAHVRVLFPDPWPKKRHVRRRLVDTSSIRRITDLLTVGGTLHLATDWPPYAHQMREVIGAEARLEPQVDAVDDGEGADGRPLWRSERPPRPVTAYEQRGLDAGRPITDLVVRRSS